MFQVDTRRLTLRLVLMVPSIGLVGQPIVSAEPPHNLHFNREIRPLLAENCFGCHGPDSIQRQADLRLDTREGALADRSGHPAVVPGQPEKSELIARISSNDPEQQMPPPKSQKSLTSSQKALLRRWIAEGAKYEEHWAFTPLRRPAVPTFDSTDSSARNPIDSFVRVRLVTEEIEPSPEADERTLIRRVYFDLTGLPPTPEEVEAFIADPAPNAYEEVVDKLLASPHYGERWSRPWLDLCHYGDSDGYLQDFARPYAWRYRDWLIDALNRDLPFDQFTIEQLAGDLLPNATVEQQIATGFLRQTLSNREGGADLEEYRVEQVADRVQTVGTTWLGLTLGCARCHDHKYDPIRQGDYFGLFAILDSGDEINIDAPLPSELAADREKLVEFEQKRNELLKPWQAAIDELQARWEKKLREAVAQPGKDQEWDRAWEVLGLVWGQGLGEGQLEGANIVLLDPARRTREQKDKILEYFLANGVAIDPRHEFPDFKPRELAEKIAELRSHLPRLSRAPTIRETQVPRAVHVHIRGDFRRRGERISPGLPGVFLPAATAQPSQQSFNRQDFARWLVSRDNPLTARVVVNRVWQEFFGSGLTKTSEDLGTRGELPTHPELLDWLAVEFMDQGWSVKRLHRLIVTSATYKQSSHFRPELAARDPDNRLLARQLSLRLSAEQIRDNALAVSGLLDRRIGGPSVRPPQPESVVQEAFDNRWTPGGAEERYRRGLYTFVQRTSPFAQNVTFDAPSTSRSCTRRERSNTPLQALTLLNDPVFLEAAQALAARVAREAEGNQNAQVARAYMLCLGRPPSPTEIKRLCKLVDKQQAELAENPELVAKLAPMAIDGIDARELAVGTCLCSVLLNLHEFITRD